MHQNQAMQIDNPTSPRFCIMNSESNLDDIILEILLWVPAKFLIRLMLVCKKWHYLISTVQFRRLHILRHPKPPPSLILTTSTSEFFYVHPFANQITPDNFKIYTPEPRILKILNSCYGLLLLNYDYLYYVYNPTTKQSAKVILTDNERYPFVAGVHLAFDPSRTPHYKIVCLKNDAKTQAYQIEVYSSEDRHWKICLEEITFTSPEVFTAHGVHCNNFIYWPSSGAAPYYDIAKNVIKYFSFPKITIPHNRTPKSWFPHLQEVNGNLHYCVVGCEIVQVWKMQGENGDQPWLFVDCDVICLPPSSSPSSADSPLRIVTQDSGKLMVCRTGVGYSGVYQFGESLAPVWFSDFLPTLRIWG